MIERALELYLQEDTLSSLAYLATQEPDREVVKACAELVTKIYWEQKDVAGVIAIALFGLSVGWKAAETHKHSEEAPQILSLTKAIAYNLASYTWPGWDEPDIRIGQNDLVLGLAAAHTNLRLAQELDVGYVPLARAHWMVGAHFLAQSDYAQADRNFALSAENAGIVGDEGEALLAEGFRVLVQLLGGLIQETQAAELMSEIKEKLLLHEGGAGFVEQLDTAYRVFVSKSR